MEKIEDEFNEILGVYRIYQGDSLLVEQKNALTSVGRAAAIKALLGYDVGIADSICVGISNAQNSFNSSSTVITNVTLGFEVGRVPINSTSSELTGNNTSLIFYGTIEDVNEYDIYEIGLARSRFPDQTTSVDGSVLFNFDQVDTFLKYGTASYVSLEDSASARIGGQMMIINQGNASANYIEKRFDYSALADLDAYSYSDTFRLAMYNTTNSVASVNFRFYTDVSNYYTLTMTSTALTGYQIVTASKGAAVITGNPDWKEIYSISIWNSSSQDVYLDALKIDTGDGVLDTNFGLVSRAILPIPVSKNPSVPLTVQYSLLTNFSGGA